MAVSRTEQVAYRGRSSDTVALNANTAGDWAAAQNTPWSQNVDTTFRVRLEVEEDAGKNETVIGQLEASLNSTTVFFSVTTISTIVRAVASSQFTDGTATTNLLTGSISTFTGGEGSHDGLAGNIALNGNHLEHEYAVEIIGADVNDGDIIRFRVGGLDLYTAVAQVTAVETVATNAPAGLATATGAAFDAEIEALVVAKTSGMDPVDKSSYTTASVTIGGGDKVALVSVLTINASSPNAPSLSGPTGVDWAVAHDFFFDQVSTFRRLTVFAGTAVSEATGTITIDYAGQNQATVLWSVVEASEVNTATSKGVVQSAENQAGGTVLTVTLPNSIRDPVDLDVGVFANGSNTTFTPGSGFLELHDLNASPETADGTLHVAWKIAGADITVDATSAITDPDLAGIALELLSTSAPPLPIPSLLMAPMVPA